MGVESRAQRQVVSVRNFRAGDADAVVAIGEEALEAASWSRESYVKFAQENESLALVMESEGEMSGFLVGRQVGHQAEILNLAVAKKQRRRGHGTALMAAALLELGSRGVKSIFLEVRESNAGAIAFYERHGFAKTGRRKGYYRAPDEAAVMMEKKLTG